MLSESLTFSTFILSILIYSTLSTEAADLFRKEPYSKYFRLCLPHVSVATTACCTKAP